ncbi:MAG: hypothetical protein ACI9TY_001494 [Alphaproteobacteria bacterium]|jgi:hypothetical protein
MYKDLQNEAFDKKFKMSHIDKPIYNHYLENYKYYG